MNPTEKSCPRCQKSFQCNVQDIQACQCSTVSLLPETRQWLANTHYDCLCSNCLEDLDAMTQKKQDIPFPKRGEPLLEQVHYYMEGGLFVFTEFYHFSRGSCCKSGCRHCAYGYKK